MATTEPGKVRVVEPVEHEKVKGSERPWKSHEEFVRVASGVRDDTLWKKLQEALRAEFAEFEKGFSDSDEAAYAFAKKCIEGTEPGPERDRILDLLMRGALPDQTIRGQLKIVLELYASPREKGGSLGSIFQRAVKLDPEWAYAAAAELEEPRQRRSAYQSATMEMCKGCEGFQEAIDQVLDHTGGAMPDHVLATIGDYTANWRPNTIPENLSEVLQETFAGIEVSREAKEEFIGTLVEPMSSQGLDEVVSLLREFEVTRQSAWGAAAQFAQGVNVENAQSFLEALPGNARYESGSLLNRLRESAGTDATMEVLAALPPERQELIADRAIPGHVQAVGLSAAIEDFREAVNSRAFERAMTTLLSPIGGLNAEDRAAVQAALDAAKSSENR